MKRATQDSAALLALALLFGVMLLATWQRWTHPIIDHGREMNVPLRLLSGERLYIDLIYYYGPFAPYFTALLYDVFGIHLNTLHISGGVCAIVILLMIYWLARQLVSPWEAALATALVLITCALSGSLGNFIQPYAYAALYGWMFALASLVCLVKYVTSHENVWMWWAGVGVGLTMTCKPEQGVLACAPVAVTWMLASLSERRVLWRPLWLAAVPAAAIGAFTYVPIVLLVPWHMLVTDTYQAFSQPQMVFFARFLNGTLGWPTTGWAITSALGMSLAACGLVTLLGLLLDQRVQSLARREAWPSWMCMLAGAGLWWLGGGTSEFFDVTPLRSAPIVLVSIIALTGWQLWRHHCRREPFPHRDQILLLLAIFSLMGIGRVVLNLSLWSPYTAFTAPTVLVLYCYLFFRTAPETMVASVRARGYARAVAMALIAIWATSLGIEHADMARLNRFEFNTPRARLLTDGVAGPPLMDAIRFTVARTQPGDYVLNLPQGSIINFVTGRPNPLREEIIVGGFLTPDREADAIKRVEARRVKLILVSNHLTPEYRDPAFGVHYNQGFMRWIEANYHPVATFSAWKGRPLRFGDREFFIRAYERNPD